jgi:hypothetical protein
MGFEQVREPSLMGVLKANGLFSGISIMCKDVGALCHTRSSSAVGPFAAVGGGFEAKKMQHRLSMS